MLVIAVALLIWNKLLFVTDVCFLVAWLCSSNDELDKLACETVVVVIIITIIITSYFKNEHKAKDRCMNVMKRLMNTASKQPNLNHNTLILKRGELAV